MVFSMIKRYSYWLLYMVFLVLLPMEVLAKEPKSLSLQEVLQRTEKNSYSISASQLREIAAMKNVDVAQSGYYPTLDAEAIDSAGFPGSSSATDVIGLMGSPYRSGVGGGVVAQQTLLDFGRTAHKVEASKYEAQFSREDTKVTDYKVKLLALQVFYECSESRTQRDTWDKLSKEADIITQQVNNFVRTGQRSVVDKYLSEAQTQEALTARAFFDARLKAANQRLAILMGMPDNSFSCPLLPRFATEPFNTNIGIYASPLLSRAAVDAKAAAARLEAQRAELFPQIVAVASAGNLQAVRLVQRSDYAAGIGIVFPLFDWHTNSEIKHAQAIALAKQQDVAAERQYLEEKNAQYDEGINSYKVQLQHLKGELDLANEAFSVAKQRYFSLEGQLVDLRDAFRNISRVQTQINDTQAKLLLSSGEKVLTDGGRV